MPPPEMPTGSPPSSLPTYKRRRVYTCGLSITNCTPSTLARYQIKKRSFILTGRNYIPSMAGTNPQPTPEGPPPTSSSSEEKWGTKFMGPPAAPSAHPENRHAALWGAQAEHHPYVLEYKPVERHTGSPMETILDVFNEWGRKAEALANNVWHNLRTGGQSMCETAWGKLSLTAKAISEGGFESLYKQTFPVDPNERLKKTFACYLSTSTGPVAGTLYLSNINIAFCSDRPLAFTAPSGQQAWSYYKVVVPLAKVANINPVTMKENPPEKYMQIVTVDGHEFWFMGFINHDKALTHLLDAVHSFSAEYLPVAEA